MERFPDKKCPEISFENALEEAKRRIDYSNKVEVSQNSATWLAFGEYPNLPIGILYMTDIHFGNKGVDYKLLEEHINIVKKTPNMFVLVGGDMIDAFSPTKHSTGMMNDLFNPDEQLEYMIDTLSDLDHLGKLGGIAKLTSLMLPKELYSLPPQMPKYPYWDTLIKPVQNRLILPENAR